MTVQFIRNPENPGLNKTIEPKGCIFQQVLGVMANEPSLSASRSGQGTFTIDIDKGGKTHLEFYLSGKIDGETIVWNDAP